MRDPNAFIDQLAEPLKPVRVRSTRRLAVQYLFTLVVFGLIFLALPGILIHVRGRRVEPEFVVSLAGLGLALCAASVNLARVSRPGLERSRVADRGLVGSLLVVVTALGVRLVAGQGPAGGWGDPLERGWACTALGLGLAIPTLWVLVREVRRQAPVDAGSAARMLVIAAALLAALALQAHCPNTHPAHELLWHGLMPLAGLALAIRPVLRRTLGW